MRNGSDFDIDNVDTRVSSDGRFIATSKEKNIIVWDTAGALQISLEKNLAFRVARREFVYRLRGSGGVPNNDIFLFGSGR